jgi:hypothetical protein
VSQNSNRSSPVPASGSSFSAGQNIYVFAIPQGPITKVSFFIDGAFVKDQFASPYDMKGTKGDGTANKYQLPGSPGSIVVTVGTHFAGGTTQSTSATISFT